MANCVTPKYIPRMKARFGEALMQLIINNGNARNISHGCENGAKEKAARHPEKDAKISHCNAFAYLEIRSKGFVHSLNLAKV